MADLEEFPMHIEYRDERDILRMQTDAMRSAALIGYGALLALNTDGKCSLVLETMAKSLFPEPPMMNQGDSR